MGDTTGITSVIQIIHDGKSDIIVANMNIAMEYVARVVATREEDRARLASMDEFPALNDEQLCGSYFHRLAREAYQQRKTFVVVEHELKGTVDGPTEVRRYDLISDFDPSFVVQDGLWAIADGTRDILEEAKMVQGFVALNIKVNRKSKSDEEVLDHVRRKHEIMKGLDLLADVGGRATDILDALPEIAREKFLELAYIAFPERAPVKTSAPTICP
jgi:hypothetical protein